VGPSKTIVGPYTPNSNSALALQIVDSALDEVRPQNVDRESITITDEGESVGIVLVPHRDLGGLALVVWIDPKYVDLSWASVWDLKDHDEIDLGKSVLRIARTDPGWETSVRAQIITEFRRNINVTVRRDFLRRVALWCTIEVKGRPADLYLARLSAGKGFGNAKVRPVGDTSLLGPESPTVKQEVPLSAWHKYGVSALPAASQRDE
jgi:hypothetical protein